MYIKKKIKRGQSTVEYVLLVTAVIVVIIAFMSTSGGMKGQLNSTLNQVTEKIGSEADLLADSHAQEKTSNEPTAVTAPPYTINVEKGLW